MVKRKREYKDKDREKRQRIDREGTKAKERVRGRQRRADPKGEFAAAVTCNQADGRHTTTRQCACALTRRRTTAPSVYRPAQGCSLRLRQFRLCHGNFPLARNNTTTSQLASDCQLFFFLYDRDFLHSFVETPILSKLNFFLKNSFVMYIHAENNKY